MVKEVVSGDKQTIERLDGELSQNYTPIKDSKGQCEGGSWTRTYVVPAGGNRVVKVRIWYNGQTGRGTLKLSPVHMNTKG